jgi:hypothetical protein
VRSFTEVHEKLAATGVATVDVAAPARETGVYDATPAPEVVSCRGSTTTTILQTRSADLEALLDPRGGSGARR